MKSLSKHWDKIFKKTKDEKLGWYEADVSQTIKFLNLIPGWENSKIFVPGVGTSNLIDRLINSNAKLYLNDLSSVAIEKAKKIYTDDKKQIRWLCHDISEPLPRDIENIDVWIDRAVLHFLTNDSEIDQYFKNVHSIVKNGGYAIFAEFSKKGATRCAGLDVKQYDITDLATKLSFFELIRHEEFTYINPRGDLRPYIYTLFKKVA